MYEELVKELRDSAEWADRLAVLMGRAEGDTHAPIMREAADAIEKLNRYAAQMDKLREDGWYLLQETAGTYGPITMKMPIPEPLSCDDVLAIINGEPPEEGEI